MVRTLRCRTTVAAAATLALAAATFTTGAGPATASGPARVMQFNICGAICNHGTVAKAGAGNDVVEDVQRRVVGFKPGIVLLNEVCVGQFNRLRSLLGGGPWRMAGA